MAGARVPLGQRYSGKVELLVMGTAGGAGSLVPVAGAAGSTGPGPVAGPPLPFRWKVVVSAKSLGVHYGDWATPTPEVAFAGRGHQ